MIVLKRLVGLHRTIKLQLLQHYWLGHRLITVVLNGLPCKQTEIILSFLRLHPSTAFQILLLTITGIQVEINGHKQYENLKV